MSGTNLYRTKSSRARLMQDAAANPKRRKPIPAIIPLENIKDDDIQIIGRKRKRLIKANNTDLCQSPPKKKRKTNLNSKKSLYPIFAAKKKRNNTSINTIGINSNDPLLYTLQSRFRLNSFRPSQRNAIESILNKKDVLLLMPTGGGKSLCFQCPALILKKLVIVISPLIALMKNHCDSLNSKGITAKIINSTVSQSEKNKIFSTLQIYATNNNNNSYKAIEILYTTPEQLTKNNTFNNLLHIMYTNNKIGLFAIDECHCISSWGHDFRPSYRGLNALRISFGNVPIMALTATATMSVRNDIIKSLRLNNPQIIVSSFDRPNLYFEFKYIENLKEITIWNKAKTKRGRAKRRKFNKKEITKSNQKVSDDIYLFITKNGFKHKCGLIYVFSRKDAETIAYYLANKYKLSCDGYHAGMSNKKKNEIQDKWQRNTINIIVATCAFGMGIDQNNVRFVIHCMINKCLESYYQEIGRAGRDNKSSNILCYYSINMLNKHKGIALKESMKKINRNRKRGKDKNQIKNMAQNDARYIQIVNNLKYVQQFAEPKQCRRQILLRYFNQNMTKKNIKCCDFCDNPRSINAIKMQYEKKRKSKGNVNIINDDDGCDNDDFDPIEDIDLYHNASNRNESMNTFSNTYNETEESMNTFYDTQSMNTFNNNYNDTKESMNTFSNNSNDTEHSMNQDINNDNGSDILLNASMTANIDGLNIKTREHAVFQFLDVIENNVKTASNGSNADNIFEMCKQKEMDIMNKSNTNFIYGLCLREEIERIQQCTQNGILYNNNNNSNIDNINSNIDIERIQQCTQNGVLENNNNSNIDNINNESHSLSNCNDNNSNINSNIQNGVLENNNNSNINLNIDINGVYSLIEALFDERDWMLSMMHRRSDFYGFINRWKPDLDNIYAPKATSLYLKYKSDLYSISSLNDVNSRLDKERMLLLSLIKGFDPNKRRQIIWNVDYDSWKEMEDQCSTFVEKRMQIIKNMLNNYEKKDDDDDDDDDLVILSLNKQHQNVQYLLSMGFNIDSMNKAWCSLKNIHPNHDSFILKMLDQMNINI